MSGKYYKQFKEFKNRNSKEPVPFDANEYLERYIKKLGSDRLNEKICELREKRRFGKLKIFFVLESGQWLQVATIPFESGIVKRHDVIDVRDIEEIKGQRVTVNYIFEASILNPYFMS